MKMFGVINGRLDCNKQNDNSSIEREFYMNSRYYYVVLELK